MDEYNSYPDVIEDEFKSYKNDLDEYNPDDYESDYWEDIQPDVDKMMEEYERRLEESGNNNR